MLLLQDKILLCVKDKYEYQEPFVKQVQTIVQNATENVFGIEMFKNKMMIRYKDV